MLTRLLLAMGCMGTVLIVVSLGLLLWTNWDPVTEQISSGDAAVNRQPLVFGRVESERKWTDVTGRSLTGSLITASPSECILRVSSNERVYRLPLEKLSSLDQEYVRSWSSLHSDRFFPPRVPSTWPGAVRTQPVLLKAVSPIDGKPTWGTPNFLFIGFAEIDLKVLKALAEVCESTNLAMRSVPLPLSWGRKAKSKRQIIIYPSKKLYVANGGMPFFSGHFDIKSQKVHLPVESIVQLTVRSNFDRLPPAERKNFHTITHEVVHQEAPLIGPPFFPAWVSEGLAEYFSFIQGTPGTFSFRNTRISIKQKLSEKLGTGVTISNLSLNHLESFSRRSLGQWNQVTAESETGEGDIQYLQALLMVEFFTHGDQNALRPYLEAVLTGVPERKAAELHLQRGRSWRRIEDLLQERWIRSGLQLNFAEDPKLNVNNLKLETGYR